MTIVEEHRLEIERDLKHGHYIPGLFILCIGTSADYPGIKYQFEGVLNRDQLVEENAFYYRLAHGTPMCKSMMPETWSRNGRVERWMVRVTESGQIVDQELLVTEILGQKESVTFNAEDLRRAVTA